MIASIAIKAAILAEPDSISRRFDVGGQGYLASLTARTDSIELAILRNGRSAPAGFLARVSGFRSTIAGPEVRQVRNYATHDRGKSIIYVEWYFESWSHSRVFLVEPHKVACLFATSHRDSSAWTFTQDRAGRLKSITFRDRWATQPTKLNKAEDKNDRYVLTTTVSPDSSGHWRPRTRGSWKPFKDLV